MRHVTPTGGPPAHVTLLFHRPPVSARLPPRLCYYHGTARGLYLIINTFRIENAEGNVLIAVYLDVCVRVICKGQKVLNRIA